MTDKLIGGPAFPSQNSTMYFHGMSLRDYLAAHASPIPNVTSGEAEKIMGKDAPDRDADPTGWFEYWFLFEAKMRYLKADAMLKARES